MSKIKAEELMDLLFLPMSDGRVVEMLDRLGIEQPIIDEKYYIDNEVVVFDEDNSGIDITFSELNGYSLDGEPILTQLDFSREYKIIFPFGITINDDYEIICKKIGKKAEFCNKRTSAWKQWVLLKNNNEVSFTIHFSKDLSSIKSIVFSDFEREGIEEDEFIFPCNE